MGRTSGAVRTGAGGDGGDGGGGTTTTRVGSTGASSRIGGGGGGTGSGAGTGSILFAERRGLLVLRATGVRSIVSGAGIGGDSGAGGGGVFSLGGVICRRRSGGDVVDRGEWCFPPPLVVYSYRGGSCPPMG